MTRHRIIRPDGAPQPSGFSHGVLAREGDRILHVAGEIATDASGSVVPGAFVDQFDQALANVVEVVRSAGGAPGDIVSMTVYTTVVQEYRESAGGLGAVWRRHMGTHYPAMALIGVAGLVEPGALVEMSAVASVPRAD